MSNFTSFGQVDGGLPGTGPRLFVVSTPDSLNTISAAGYLNDLGTKGKIKANDVFFINYADTSTFPLSTGENATYGEFLVAYSAPNWTLIEKIVPVDALTLTDGHILVGNVDNEASDVALTGQLAITNAGVGSVVAGAITQLEIEPSNRYKATLIYADTRHSTLASGSLQTFNTPGLVNTDYLQVQLLGIGSFPTLTIQWAQIVTGTVLVQFSEDPSDEALFGILAWRATAPP